MPASKKAKFEYDQVRFIKGLLPSSYTADAFPRLCTDPRVKYFAVFRSAQDAWVVLAQARDKITLNKWDKLFHPALEHVEREMDMKKALEDARTQSPDDFQEQGVFTFCKARPVVAARQLVDEPAIAPSTARENERQPLVAARQLVATARENERQPLVAARQLVATARENERQPAAVPTFLQANDAVRKAYMDAARCWDARRRDMPPPIPSDYEADLDDMFPMARKNTTLKDIHALLDRGRALARQSALGYMEELRRSNKLRDNMIPPCLRGT